MKILGISSGSAPQGSQQPLNPSGCEKRNFLFIEGKNVVFVDDFSIEMTVYILRLKQKNDSCLNSRNKYFSTSRFSSNIFISRVLTLGQSYWVCLLLKQNGGREFAIKIMKFF